ncbi:DUF58 domain-containing protein [Rubritalea marina]|uniref:DUF58 domain-containing protein n=1 Tax=Rubritalea marina TaxID=361055 RepID=UPI0003642B12|nr:DUF58 domain-containing protein [Rubritalea marina]
MNDFIEHQLNLLELKCRRPVEHLLAGEYRSIFKGSGIEFEDVRLYQAGDDVRAMDWKVTARTGEAHIKRYIEEREQFFYLLVDLSASMSHDEQGRKRRTMTELGAMLTMAAIQNQDRVGLIAFTDQVELVIPPAKGRSQALRIMDALSNFQPQGRGTNLVETLQQFGHITKKRSIVFVISDFLTDAYSQELQSLSLRHDVNAIHIADTNPATAKNARGLMRIEDAETGEQRVVDSAASSGHQQHSTALKHSMLSSGIDLLEVNVGDNTAEALAGYFHARHRREADETGG